MPAELAPYAGLDVAHPFGIGLLPLLGTKDVAPLSTAAMAGRQGGGIGIPLLGQPRLDHHARAVAMRHLIDMGLDLLEQTCLCHFVDDDSTRLEPVGAMQPHDQRHQILAARHAGDEIGIVAERHRAVGGKNVDHRQSVPTGDLEIVEVMRRGDLDRAGPLLGIGIGVGDDGDAAADQRQNRVLPDQIAIALVVGMDGDAGVAEHRLGPGGGDRDERVGTLEGIAEVPELALHLDVEHLEVGDGGQELGVPIDEPPVLVDQALLMKLDEDLDDGPRQPLIHGEALARPVAGGAEPPQLLGDLAAGMVLPLPDAADEGFRPHAPPVGLILLRQQPLHHHLGGDAGMVGAGLPQHVGRATARNGTIYPGS